MCALWLITCYLTVAEVGAAAVPDVVGQKARLAHALVAARKEELRRGPCFGCAVA